MSIFPGKRIEGTGEAIQNWDEESVDQKHALGRVWDLNDGSGDRYVYCKNGAVALAVGLAIQGPARISNHEGFTGGSGTVGALDSTEITIGQTVTTALTANQYNDGHIIIESSTGLGQSWAIDSHTESVTPVFQIRSFIRVALSTTSVFTITPNKYRDTILRSTNATATCVGFPQIAVTAAFYFWSKIQGVTAAIVDTAETLIIGQSVGQAATTSVSGSVGIPSATNFVYGTVENVATQTQYATIYLHLGE